MISSLCSDLRALVENLGSVMSSVWPITSASRLKVLSVLETITTHLPSWHRKVPAGAAPRLMWPALSRTAPVRSYWEMMVSRKRKTGS